MISNRFRQSDNGAEYDGNQNWVTRVPRPIYHRMGEDGGLYPWRLFEERVRTGPFGLSRFPLQPFSPVRVLIIDGGGGGGAYRISSGNDGINPRLRRFIQNSPPRIRNEWNVWNGTETGSEEPPSLTDGEFKAAMKRLKKQAYQTPGPPKRPHRRGLFGGGNKSTKNNEIAVDVMPSDCTICLEAFVPNEHVLVTPCKHVFHDDCITPWVRSHGKCPICRLAFCERSTQRSNSNNNNNNFYVDNNYYNDNNRRAIGAGETVAGEEEEEEEMAVQLLALIRAMEEAFNWVTFSRAISFD